MLSPVYQTCNSNDQKGSSAMKRYHTIGSFHQTGMDFTGKGLGHRHFKNQPDLTIQSCCLNIQEIFFLGEAQLKLRNHQSPPGRCPASLTRVRPIKQFLQNDFDKCQQTLVRLLSLEISISWARETGKCNHKTVTVLEELWVDPNTAKAFRIL